MLSTACLILFFVYLGSLYGLSSVPRGSASLWVRAAQVSSGIVGSSSSTRSPRPRPVDASTSRVPAGFPAAAASFACFSAAAASPARYPDMAASRVYSSAAATWHVGSPAVGAFVAGYSDAATLHGGPPVVVPLIGTTLGMC